MKSAGDRLARLLPPIAIVILVLAVVDRPGVVTVSMLAVLVLGELVRARQWLGQKLG